MADPGGGAEPAYAPPPKILKIYIFHQYICKTHVYEHLKKTKKIGFVQPIHQSLTPP